MLKWVKKMFAMDQTKTQLPEILTPEQAPPEAIISADTRRAKRVPPGQSRTLKWQILDASGPPTIDLDKWTLSLQGLVQTPRSLSWKEFNGLPRVKVFADFHCVTRWSRLGNVWEGVSVQELVKQAGGVFPDARFVLAHGFDHGWTTNLPLTDFLAADALVATHHDGAPITLEHGAPARLIVPSLYAWKSAKWVSAIEFLPQDKAGFWERNGYHCTATLGPRNALVGSSPQTFLRPKLQATWIGHTTVLLKLGDLNIITDPVFGKRCGLYLGAANIGPKRLVPPAISLSHLPKIDLILLSHAHMDHFDIPSLRALENRGTQVVTARRTSDLLRVRRYGQVTELGWGEAVQIGPLRIGAFPERHWGARKITDVWRGYNGYTIEGEGMRILFGGDTAITDTFRSLKSSKRFDLAILPIGAYDPWITNHCTPEQAWKMGTEAGADAWLPVHHKTFPLGREPVHEPLERFLNVAGANVSQVMTRNIGDTCRLG